MRTKFCRRRTTQVERQSSKTRDLITRCGLLASSVAGLLLVCSGNALALQFDVTRVDDPVPDGCQPADCSLREAVIAANASAGSDVVVLQALTYVLTQVGGGDLGGELEVHDDLSVEGVSDGSGNPLTVIDVLPVYRHFFVDPATSLSLSDLQLTDGSAPSGQGGSIEVNGGSLSLNRVHLISNSGVSGGAVSIIQGSLTIRDSLFQFNAAQQNGGAVFAVFSLVDIRNTTISQNSADAAGITNRGGALYATGGEVVIVNGRFEMNTVRDFGGAMYFENIDRGILYSTDVILNSAFLGNAEGGGLWSTADAELSIINSNFDQNSAGGRGGGLFIGESGSMDQTTRFVGGTVTGNTAHSGGGMLVQSSMVTIDTTLISGNQAMGGGSTPQGGGILATGQGLGGIDGIVIRDSLIADNETTGLGGGLVTEEAELLIENSTISANLAVMDGGGVNALQSTLTFRHTTLANNTGVLASELRNPLTLVTFENSIINGSCQYLLMPSSNGGNVSGPDVSCSGTPGPTDQWGVSAAQLDLNPALSDNGGPTETLALGPDSVAIDAGLCGPDCLETDQRGYSRSDDEPDSGAYEFRARRPSLLFHDSLELYGL